MNNQNGTPGNGSIKFSTRLVTGIVVVLFAALITWANSLQGWSAQTDSRLTKLETHYEHIASDVAEVKEGIKELLAR